MLQHNVKTFIIVFFRNQFRFVILIKSLQQSFNNLIIAKLLFIVKDSVEHIADSIYLGTLNCH